MSTATRARTDTVRRRYALWLSRVGCWVIDALGPAVLILTGYLMGQPTYRLENEFVNGVSYEVSTSNGLRPAFFVFACLAIAFLVWNQGYREGRTGKSLGKQLLGFTTLRESTGAPLGFVRATLRVALLTVDFGLCYLGVLWPLWDPKRQCLVSDKVSGAIVVHDEQPVNHEVNDKVNDE